MQTLTCLHACRQWLAPKAVCTSTLPCVLDSSKGHKCDAAGGKTASNSASLAWNNTGGTAHSQHDQQKVLAHAALMNLVHNHMRHIMQQRVVDESPQQDAGRAE